MGYLIKAARVRFQEELPRCGLSYIDRGGVGPSKYHIGEQTREMKDRNRGWKAIFSKEGKPDKLHQRPSPKGENLGEFVSQGDTAIWGL